MGGLCSTSRRICRGSLSTVLPTHTCNAPSEVVRQRAKKEVPATWTAHGRYQKKEKEKTKRTSNNFEKISVSVNSKLSPHPLQTTPDTLKILVSFLYSLWVFNPHIRKERRKNVRVQKTKATVPLKRCQASPLELYLVHGFHTENLELLESHGVPLTDGRLEPGRANSLRFHLK